MKISSPLVILFALTIAFSPVVSLKLLEIGNEEHEKVVYTSGLPSIFYILKDGEVDTKIQTLLEKVYQENQKRVNIVTVDDSKDTGKDFIK